jgi:ABC-2 type transport system permease protein
VSAVDQAIARADAGGAGQAAADLATQLGQIRATLQRTVGIADQLVEQAPDTLAGPAATASDALTQLEAKVASLQSTLAGGDVAAAKQQLAEIDQTLSTVHQNFDAFTTVEAGVLVRPFTSLVATSEPGRHPITDFYAPAAVVLLVQQFGVAFGALSFVRERELGTVELYQAGPLSAGPILVGKFLGYLLIGGAVAALLELLIIGALDVPLQGSVGAVAIVLGLVLLGSIGLGFLISLVSRNDTQAVQYSMIVLLASLFFSGFFLATERLVYPARLISWLLPATFGIDLLRDVMLRGVDLDRNTLAALGAYAAVVVALTYIGTRRLLRAD